MADRFPCLADRHLDTVTMMSCKREPVCFAFLCSNALTAPTVIEKLYFDLSSADFFNNRASVWGTLDMRDDEEPFQTMSLLGFDESFLRPFSRSILEASATRMPHRMTIKPDPNRPTAPRVVDHVRGPGGTRIDELTIIPYDQILAVTVPSDIQDVDETLFQLPRTDSFLRSFARMAQLADGALRETQLAMEQMARQAKQ